jgi:hypothetical protein
MNFDTKASNIILVIFQMKVIFQQNVSFQHTCVHLNEKLVWMFFAKLHESNFSIVLEMVQWIHIQYITKYFIEFWNICTHNLGVHKPNYFTTCLQPLIKNNILPLVWNIFIIKLKWPWGFENIPCHGLWLVGITLLPFLN